MPGDSLRKKADPVLPAKEVAKGSTENVENKKKSGSNENDQEKKRNSEEEEAKGSKEEFKGMKDRDKDREKPAHPQKQPAPQKREKMKPNDLVKNESTVWKVVQLLGSGGFGDVYKVFNENAKDGKEFAMKTETLGGHRRLMRLKIEVMVLMDCQEAPAIHRQHFVEFIDKGKTDNFKFLVMSLVGPSLEDVRKTYLAHNYSMATAMYCAMQTLDAVADLHFLGYLHRDIKPANFAVGLNEPQAQIYVLDFGISRRHIDPKTGQPKGPRSRVKFIGTMRFAARACHLLQDQGRKDDLESWMYMVSFFVNRDLEDLDFF
ncbi:unnamed protein product [Caenorhabditis auriculariae]|uniref:Protein kinase domain-containing protein n=1 Tax=Caenorhabditis auriculariae TaxID=2777116 RepID=A0A8S1HPB9_9PELO|nr:unnamed protein product [Caenorhabditis auriculariae]